MDNQNQPKNTNLSMQEMFAEYPIGSTIQGEVVKGYRQTKNESAIMLSNGSWKNLSDS